MQGPDMKRMQTFWKYSRIPPPAPTHKTGKKRRGISKKILHYSLLLQALVFQSLLEVSQSEAGDSEIKCYHEKGSC